LLVDPSPHPDRLEPLLFANASLGPGDIDMIFVTHYHGDHRYGLDLFAGKPWVMASAGLDEWRKAVPAERAVWDRFMIAEDLLFAGVTLLPTPGHTLAHYSLSVETMDGRLIVAGDAVMTRDFFKAAQGFHNSADLAQATETIQAIQRVADLVVPGHGNYFPNSRQRIPRAYVDER
jgi:glyoxylase-like metal-dependent hydrolase (beta-lactamase superfamily II)